MKKFFKLGKRMLALFIVVLLNINSYAAVGANDGSAFVTKAEFDALVNTFNEQMDTYQSGLNAKIDGAIANYLAGLSSEQVLPQENLYTQCCKLNKNGVNYRFVKESFTPATTKLPTGGTAGGEIYWGSNGKQVNLWFTGSSSSGKGTFYKVDDYGGLIELCDIYVAHTMGGAWSGSGGGTSVTRTDITGNPTTYGNYSKYLTIGGKGITVIYGYNEQKSTTTEFNNYTLYQTIGNANTYFIYEADKNKVKVAGKATTGTAVRGIKLGESTNLTATGTWQFAICDPCYTQKPANEVIGNPSASQIMGTKVLNYEGCPVVKVDTAGDYLKMVIKWTTNLTTTNYVQTGIQKNSRFANDGVVVIDPSLTTNLDNNVLEAGKEIEIRVKNVNKNDVFWIKGLPVNGTYAELEVISVAVIKE